MKDVVGILTAYGRLGEKPQHPMRFTGISHDNALINDITQKIGDWRVADIKDID
jgi:hypothetical protein